MAMASLLVLPGRAQAQAEGAAKAQVEAEAQSQAGAHVAKYRQEDPSNLTELRKEAEQAAKKLEDATKALEKRQATAKAAREQLKGKLLVLRESELQLGRIRQPVSELAELLYGQPIGADGVVPFLSGDTDTDTLRAMASVNYMVKTRQEVVERTSVLTERTESLAAEAQELRAGNLLAEAQLAAEVDLLRKQSDKIVKSLTAALVKLGIKIDKVGRAALGCNPLRATTAGNYPNGLIPGAMLCPLQQRGHSLRADATIAFVSLNEAYKQTFGRPICVTDAYRNLAEQQSIYYRRPGFAAVPGRSNHGLGLAVDLCGGVERFRSAEFNWLEKNGKRYGWFHPDWAYSSPFEPWHWEYDPKMDKLP